MAMQLTQGDVGLVQARAEFRKAHARAQLRGLFSRLMRRCVRLCSLGDAADHLAQQAEGGAAGWARRPSLTATAHTRLADVPIARIVGSLDRADDYTDDFLPLIGSDEERWARVRVAADSLEGLPPVELYELDGEYYVKDGHHRISVMRRMGIRSVEAYVSKLLAA